MNRENEYRLEQSENLNKINRVGVTFGVLFITYLMLFTDPRNFPEFYRLMIPGRLILIVPGLVLIVFSFLPGMRKHGIFTAFLVFLVTNLQMAHLTAVMNNHTSDVIAWLFVSIFFCGIYPVPIGYALIVVVLSNIYYLVAFFIMGYEPDPDFRLVLININTASFIPLAFKIGTQRIRKREFLFRKGLERANREIAQLNEQLKDENMRLSHELQVAQHIQSIVLPQKRDYERFADLDIACRMIPATEVGGDFYDTISFDDGGIIAIGDVTDHGLHSGLIMMMVHTAIRTLSNVERRDIQKIFRVVNHVLYDFRLKTNDHRIMSLLILRYAGAGRFELTGQHESILIFRSDGAVEEISTLEYGMYAGLDESADAYLNVKDIELTDGESIVLYTDGVTEAMNSSKQVYGEAGIIDAALPFRTAAAERIMDAIVDGCRTHIGDERVYDDISVVVVKKRSVGEN